MKAHLRFGVVERPTVDAATEPVGTTVLYSQPVGPQSCRMQVAALLKSEVRRQHARIATDAGFAARSAMSAAKQRSSVRAGRRMTSGGWGGLRGLAWRPERA